MKSFWTKNIGIKIASLVFAGILWIIVTNLNDPVDSKSFDNIPVRILNTQILDDTNRVYQVLDDTDIIPRVTVRASRSVISRISQHDIIARADINEMSSLDTIAVNISVNNVSDLEINEIIPPNNILRLEIEDRKERRFLIQPQVLGDVAEGYMYDQSLINVEPNTVVITGPESIINMVSSARTKVDISSTYDEISTYSDVVFYDADGNQIPTGRLSQTVRNVLVRVPVLQTKLIPVRYTVTGIPAPGYRLNGVDDISLSEVLIAGNSSFIRNINEIIIPDAIDISDSTETFIRDFSINEYLHNNVRLVNPEENNVRIMVGIEEEARRTISLQINQLRIENLPDGFTADFGLLEETTPVVLVGLRRDLDLINTGAIYGDVDIAKWMADRNMEELSEGSYSIPVDINLGSNITVNNTISVPVFIALIEGDDL